jgi:predicted acylesterase/phospholipase RssA/CRP-like cAMP-binding protein
MTTQAEAASPSGDVPASDLAALAEQYCLDDPFARRMMATEAQHVSLCRGQCLFEQGDPGDSMYLLVVGRLSVILRHDDGGETLLDELEPGAVVGEMALLTGQARSATVRALEDAELLGCTKAKFEKLAARHPQELAGFVQAITHRLRETQLACVLGDLFGEIDGEALDALQAELEWQQLGHGEALFHQGDPGDEMYIVVSGRLRVTATRPDGTEQILGEVGPAEVVGEGGLLTGLAHAANVYAIRETNVVKLAKRVFERLAREHPQVMVEIARMVVERQQRTIEAAPVECARALTVALAAASPATPLAAFAHRLTQNLEAYGPVLTLDAARLDQLYGKAGAAQTTLDDPTHLVLAGWLSEQETAFRYILYVADPTWSPWTERCVRQADRLLIVARADDDPTPGAVENHIQSLVAAQSLSAVARTDLVLLHPANVTCPQDTARWLVLRQVHAHHHIREGDDAHYQRLARQLVGRAVGLVLSGGGARGWAHVGAFRALNEANVPVDRVGGTSMGALVGAGCAMDLPYEEMVRLAAQFADPRQLFDYTLPFVSLMTTRKITGVLQKVFGDLRIEDLWRPFFCVSCNLSQAEPMVHQSGLLWLAVRASIAVPGLFAPILHRGNVLVDGGVMNNFPVDIMREFCEGGAVIGVSVNPIKEKIQRYEFGFSVSGWRVLWSRLNPLTRPLQVPTLTTNLLRILEVNTAHQIMTQRSLADLLILPDVKEYGILDFDEYAPIIEAGYQAAREQLAGWRP